MTIIKEPQFVKKIKAKLLIQDEFQKLDFLTQELIHGNASEADSDYWDESLEKVKEYVKYVPQHKEKYKEYKRKRTWLENVIRVQRLKKYTGSILVASSLYGLFDTLRVQRNKHEKKDDVVVVLGDWMSFEGDETSIPKAMELIEEGVIFLKGKNEEAYLSTVSEDDFESQFVQSLPTDVQTPHTVLTTGNASKEPMQMIDFYKEDTQNLTGKTIVAVHPVEGEASSYEKEKDLILIAPGDALRLNLKEKE